MLQGRSSISVVAIRDGPTVLLQISVAISSANGSSSLWFAGWRGLWFARAVPGFVVSTGVDSVLELT